MIIINTSSQNWQSECLALAQAKASFVVDYFNESDVVFLKNLCAFCHYNMLATGFSIYFEPNSPLE